MRLLGMAAALIAALALGPTVAPEDLRIARDRYGRVAYVPGQSEVACPPADARTAVLVVVGQSNAGNHGAPRPAVSRGDRILNVYEGRCYGATSPLRGATGEGSAYWDHLAALLIDSGRYERVLIAPFALDGVRARPWAYGEPLHEPFIQMVHDLDRVQPVTHILWHQGESDFLLRTAPERYEAQVQSLVQGLRKAGVKAPFFVAQATRCTAAAWSFQHSLTEAQRRLATTLPGGAAGPDADTVWGPDQRFDNCHFSAVGQLTMAQRWFNALTSAAAATPPPPPPTPAR